MRGGVRQIVESLDPQKITDAERLGRPGFENLKRGQSRREDYCPSRDRQRPPTPQQIPRPALIR